MDLTCILQLFMLNHHKYSCAGKQTKRHNARDSIMVTNSTAISLNRFCIGDNISGLCPMFHLRVLVINLVPKSLFSHPNFDIDRYMIAHKDAAS